MDATLGDAGAACFDVQLAGLEEACHPGDRSGRIGNDDGGAVALGGQREVGARLEQQHRCRWAVEHAVAAPQRGVALAAGIDAGTALEDDDRDLMVTGRPREAPASSQSMLGEPDVRPTSVVWR